MSDKMETSSSDEVQILNVNLKDADEPMEHASQQSPCPDLKDDEQASQPSSCPDSDGEKERKRTKQAKLMTPKPKTMKQKREQRRERRAMQDALQRDSSQPSGAGMQKEWKGIIINQ